MLVLNRQRVAVGCPGCHRPVASLFEAGSEVESYVDDDLLTRLDIDRVQCLTSFIELLPLFLAVAYPDRVNEVVTACLRGLTLIPSVGGHPDFLVCCRCQDELVSSIRLIVELKEVSDAPALVVHIVGDDIEVEGEGCYWHKEDAIICDNRTCLFT